MIVSELKESPLPRGAPEHDSFQKESPLMASQPTPMTNKALKRGLLTIVVPLARPYLGSISHAGNLHGGRLTSHDSKGSILR